MIVSAVCLLGLGGCADELTGDELVWVPIPAGTFTMGCLPGDTACDGPNGLYGETPRVEVTLAAFEMNATEVTQYQYWRVTGEQPSFHPTCGDCPIEYMPNHYEDAKAFCEAVGGRLPSEAEWEYAARAGSTTLYICGDDVACLEDVAWHGHNSVAATGLRHPQPVALKAPNAWGLYDMAGNVQEWTEDCSHPDLDGLPTDGRPWMDGPTADCSRHVFKGCTYNTEIGTGDTHDWMTRPSGRYWDPEDIRGLADGFRCARDVAP